MNTKLSKELPGHLSCDVILTTEGDVSSEINGHAALAAQVGIMGKSIAQAGASAFASIMATQLVVQPWTDVDMTRSKELLVDDITVRGIPN